MSDLIIIIVAWLVVSQVIALVAIGVRSDEDKLDSWSAVFFVGLLFVLYAPIYLLARLVSVFKRRDVTPDDIF